MCTIDAVLPFFNNEKKPYKYKQDMALYNLSGVDQIGKWEPRTKFGKAIKDITDKIQQKGEDAKEDIKNALDKVKVVGLAIPRNAFLILVEFNVRGLATRLQRLQAKNPADLEKLWVKQLGGDITFLNQVIKEGSAKKPFLGSRINGVDQIGVAAEGGVAAIITASTPVLLAVIAILAQNKTPDNDLPPFDVPPPDGDEVYDKNLPGGEDRELTDEEKDRIADGIIKKEFGDDKKTINPMILVGGAAIALYFLTKKK
jgi:hypothetical protein